MLTEIAPGIDPEKDILPYMEFRPVISPNLTQMPAGIYRTEWGQLKQMLSP
jgi:propionate CoA-transferase